MSFRFFRHLQNGNSIALLFSANTVSGFAQGISMLAIPWYFAQTVEQNTFFGNLYAIITFISLFWGLYVGVLIDKYKRKTIFLWENFAGGVLLTTATIVGYVLGEVPMPLVALVFAGTFFNFNVHYPALHAFVQEVSAKEDYSRITSYLEIQGQVTTALSGALAAILLSGVSKGTVNVLGYSFYFPFSFAAWSLTDVFMLDSITYWLALLFIIPIQYQSIAVRHVETESLIARFKIGLHFLQKNIVLFIFGNASYFIFVCTMVINFGMLPGYALHELNGGANTYAIGDIFWSIGSALAGAFIGRWFKGSNTVKGNIIMTGLAATSLLFLAFFRNVYLFYAMLFLFGWANAGARVLRVTYLFHHIPNQIIGRTSGVFQVVNVLLRFLFIVVCTQSFMLANMTYPLLILSAGCWFSLFIMLRYYKQLSGK